MTYEIKRDAESIWFALQTAVAALSGWGPLALGVDAAVVVIVAGAIGSITRPILGYLIRFLPKPKEDA